MVNSNSSQSNLTIKGVKKACIPNNSPPGRHKVLTSKQLILKKEDVFNRI